MNFIAEDFKARIILIDDIQRCIDMMRSADADDISLVHNLRETCPVTDLGIITINEQHLMRGNKIVVDSNTYVIKMIDWNIHFFDNSARIGLIVCEESVSS